MNDWGVYDVVPEPSEDAKQKVCLIVCSEARDREDAMDLLRLLGLLGRDCE